jgi:hypothetical protein
MVKRVAGSAVVAVALGGAMAAAASDMPTVAADVRVGAISVGGLSSGAARTRLEAVVAKRVRVVHAGRVWRFSRARLGGVVELDKTLGDALEAPTKARVELGMRVDPRVLSAQIERLATRVERPAIDARLVGLDAKGRPRIAPERSGLTVRRAATTRLLLRTLAFGDRRTIRLPVVPVRPRVTRTSFGPVVVIDRAANTLRLFDGQRLVRKFRIATGQASYPTPSGTFRIVRKEENPWWYPPPSPWARGLRPVPPGPSNPLGTRWMGLSVPAVGIHGTPSAASIGYSASHGCIRMLIPEAAWLFERVRLGTPVVIV